MPRDGPGSQNNPQRSRFMLMCIDAVGLVVLTALKETTTLRLSLETVNVRDKLACRPVLTRAIVTIILFARIRCVGSFPLRCAISGEVKTFKTANNRTFAQKCFVFSVYSDEEVIKKVQIVCDLLIFEGHQALCVQNRGRWKTSSWCAWQDHWEC